MTIEIFVSGERWYTASDGEMKDVFPNGIPDLGQIVTVWGCKLKVVLKEYVTGEKLSITAQIVY